MDPDSGGCSRRTVLCGGHETDRRECSGSGIRATLAAEGYRDVLHTSLLHGPLPVALLTAGLLALAVLVLRRGRRWWTRRVPVALLVGVLTAVLLVLIVQVWWRPFPDPLPHVTVLWAGLTAAALTLALIRPVRLLGRLAALGAVVLVGLAGANQLNLYFAAYPTVGAALGVPLPNQVSFAAITPRAARLVTATAGQPLSAAWTPPPNMPTAGKVTTADIPGTVSGFVARPAYIYLPPAYLSNPRAQLPVLVLVSGQPGTPRDWFDGGQLAATMDTYAKAHAGLAPLVVTPDSLGSRLAHPVCIDSPLGNVLRYLTVDVPSWIRSHFQVDPNQRHWAFGGVSAGGTCALQVGVTAPQVYPTFLDLSGEKASGNGNPGRTLAEVFGGAAAAAARADPLHILAKQKFPGSAATIVVGRDDGRFRPQAEQVQAALAKAGVQVRFLQLPGGHSWRVWGPGLTQSLPWLAGRMGLTP